MQNSTEKFKETIERYLAQRLLKDELFVHSMAKPGKNIDDCITYIITTVQKSGKMAFTDAEIYSMAVHYYDEDKIEVGTPVQCHIVSSAEEPEISTPSEQAEETEKKPVVPMNGKYIQPSLF